MEFVRPESWRFSRPKGWCATPTNLQNGRRCHHPNGQLVKGVTSQQWPSGKGKYCKLTQQQMFSKAPNKKEEHNCMFLDGKPTLTQLFLFLCFLLRHNSAEGGLTWNPTAWGNFQRPFCKGIAWWFQVNQRLLQNIHGFLHLQSLSKPW